MEYLVKAFSTPVRTLTIKELAERLRKRYTSLLTLPESQSVWALKVPTETTRALMNDLLSRVSDATVILAKELNVDCERLKKLIKALIAYVIKHSYFKDVLEGRGFIIPSPYDLFWTFYIAHVTDVKVRPTLDLIKDLLQSLGKQRVIGLLEDVSKILEDEEEKNKVIGAVNELFKENHELKKLIIIYIVLKALKESVGEEAELLFYLLPADTRPAANVSSLFAHIAMTTAIVQAISPDNVNASLCAIFHDLGKAYGIRRHAAGSAEALEVFLDRLSKKLDWVGNCDFEKVKECIKEHHDEKVSDETVNVVRCGDQLSASYDRLSKLIKRYEKELKEILGDELYETIKGSFEGNREARRQSVEILKDEEKVERIRNASEFVARKMFDPLEAEEIANTLGGVKIPEVCRERVDHVNLMLIDIGGVQRSIKKASKLRSLAGISYVIDLITNVLIPFEIAKLHGPENVIFSGGGSVLAIVSDIDVIEKSIAFILDDLLLSLATDITVRIGWDNLRSDFSKSIEEARRSLLQNTIEVSSEEVQRIKELEEIFFGLNKCDWCGERFGWIKYKQNGETSTICSRCASSYLLSDYFGYRKDGIRIEAAERLGVKYQEDPVKTLKDGEEGGFIAAVKADGNMMGLFIANSLTPSIFQERSFRVDVATKRSLKKVFEALSDVDKAKFILGFLYAGGDDFAAILPPSLAMATSTAFAYLFSAELGFKVSSSVGVSAGFFKAPIWEVIDSADHLLDEISKSRMREKMLRCLRLKENCYGFISFAFREGLISKYIAESLVSERQPYDALSLINLISRLSGVGNGVGEVATVDQDIIVENTIKAILNKLGEVREAFVEVNKGVRWIHSMGGGLSPSNLFYAMSKAKEEGKRTWEVTYRYILKNGEVRGERFVSIENDLVLLYKFFKNYEEVGK